MALTSKVMVENDPRMYLGTPAENYRCIIRREATGDTPLIEVIASLPQNYTPAVTSTYEDTFAQGAMNSLGKGLRTFGISTISQSMTGKIWQGSSHMSFSLPLVLQVESDPQADVVVPLMNLYRLAIPSRSKQGGLLRSPGPSLNLQKLLEALGSGGSSNEGTLRQEAEKSGAAANGIIDNLLDGNRAKATSQTANGILAPIDSLASGLDRIIKSAVEGGVSVTIGNFQYFDNVVVSSVSPNTSVLPLSDGTYSRVEVTVEFSTLFVPTHDDLPNIFKTAKRPAISSEDARPQTAPAAERRQQEQRFPPDPASDEERINRRGRVFGGI